MKSDSRKKRRRDRMMHSNSFDTQEVKEIGRKEAGEWRSVSHLVNENNGRCLWMQIKECQVQERLKM